jgi:uncharacterized protein DUF4031
MSVYVDDARIPARVGRLLGRWSHLTADTPAELHAFAVRLGLRRGWFQDRCKSRLCPRPCPIHWHYDVTDAKRAAAIRLGAVPIGWREMGEIMRARRAAVGHGSAGAGS